MAAKVGSARIDENGKAHSGQAGDQNSREVSTQNWYLHSKGWRVYRAKNPAVAEKIAQCMERACKNDKIGYDQYQRHTLYKAAEPLGFDVSKVTKACETDCSALVRVCCAYAGITGLPESFRTGNHEAIILPDEFEQVQAELARRKRSGRTFSGNSVFASRLICGDCGGYYGQKVWHSNDPYRKVIWRCNRKYGKGQRCSTPTLSEDAIKALFVKAYNLLLGNRETVIEDCETLVAMLEDTAALDARIAASQEEIDTVVEMNKALIREHAVTGMEQSSFDRKAKELDERFRKADVKLNRLNAEKQDRLMRACGVKKYVENLRGQAGPIDVWNEQAWCLLVTQVTVHADGSAEFLFRGENSITVK